MLALLLSFQDLSLSKIHARPFRVRGDRSINRLQDQSVLIVANVSLSVGAHSALSATF